MRKSLLSVLFLAGFVLATKTFAENTNLMVASADQLKKLSLEQLMDLEVTTVSRRQERVTEAAAAVHIITQEDIRRSGARSIPEALRLAPNLQVAQVSSREWAISSRGFNGTIANKLLVMVDGRSVYTPLFSGVFWDVQDMLLEDLDRIEVVSGPGATLWGANAVNGVINVISKTARDTQGTLLTAGGGTEERGFGGVRYGGKISDDVHYRVYAKYFNRDSTKLPSGADSPDAWEMARGGFRMDWDVREDNLVTIQGDVYHGEADQLINSDLNLTGGNLLARWTRQLSDASKFQLQGYYDRTHGDNPGTFTDNLDTYDVDSQFETQVGERQYITVGVGYRFTHNEVENTPVLAFLPAELDRHLFSSFIQDEISLTDHIKMTLGSKFEHNEYTGFEIQPSARLAWTNERQVVWGAVSRAVRTPSRIDRHFYVPGVPPYFVAGGPNFDSEKLIAYELGYRVKPHDRVFATISTFYNDYDDLRSLTPPPLPFVENGLEGETYGVELELTYQATEWWRLTGGYTWLNEHLRVKSGHVDVGSGRGETSDPEQQFLVRSSMDLPRDFEFDLMFRYVDTLHNFSGGRAGSVPNYVQLDARIGWMVTKNVELSLVGQNLLDNQHPEFGFPQPSRREIERGFYGKVTWRF